MFKRKSKNKNCERAAGALVKFVLGTRVLEKYSKGAENGRKVELKLLTQGHHGG